MRRYLILSLVVFSTACSLRSVTVEKVVDTESFSGLSYFLPKGIVDLTISRKRPAGSNPAPAKIVTLEVGAVRYVADPEFHYAVNIGHDVFYHDKIVVQVTEEGLLSSISSDTEDKTPEIIRRLSNAPIEVLQAPTTIKAAKALSGKYEDYEIKFTLDPTNNNDRSRLNQLLDKIDPTITFSAKPLARISSEMPPPDCNIDPCFRPGIPYALELVSNGRSEQVQEDDPKKFTPGVDAEPKKEVVPTKSEGETPPAQARPLNVGLNVNASAPDAGLVVARSIVILPNKNIVGQIALTRAPFVQKKFNLSFTKGMLTKADLDNPSEALGFIQIPIDVAKAIISIPTALFEYKVRHVNEDNRLLTAQKQNLDLQKQVIDAQRALVMQTGTP